MSRFSLIRAFAWLLTAGTFLPLAAAQNETPAPATSPAPMIVPAPGIAAAPVNFYSPRTMLWLGRTAVLPFHSASAAPEDATYLASAFDPSIVEIVRPPALLSGETTGYLRVRALRPGHTRLTIQGNAAIELEVRADPAAAAFAQIDAESIRPRIVTPMPDAVVWGQFAVGVEVFDAHETTPAGQSGPALTNPPAQPVPAVPAGGDSPTVRLRLPGGVLLAPISGTGPEFGPMRHYQFNVPAAELPAGPLSLVAMSTPAGFTEMDRRAGRGTPVESQPLTLRNVRSPSPEDLLSGECENPAIMGPTKDIYAPARPSRFGTRQPDINKDDAASGGQAVSAGNAWCLPIVLKEAGEYQFFIQARGDFAGGAFATAALYLDNADAPLGSVRLTGAKYQRLPIGSTVRLEAGPQVLSVSFRNGFGHGKENRNLSLDRFELARVKEVAVAATGTGQMPAARGVGTVPLAMPRNDYVLTSLALPVQPPAPRLNILYPAEGASVFGVDAVVGRFSGQVPDAARPAWVDVLIDGQPQGVRLTGPATTGTMVFPLLLRQMTPGCHRVALRAADPAGRLTETPGQTLTVLADRPLARGPYERAVFLLDRLAFGPEPAELAAVLTMGETAWLNQRLASGFDTAGEQALLRVACKRYSHADDSYQTCCRALNQWIASENPVRSRFTAWVENHFSTWMNKIESGAQWRSHLAFCRLGIAPFADLLSASAHSPAMLVYLDQAKSYANKLNENYAREIMELHTLGVHGGYSQTDVTALASVLNGWTVVQEAILPQDDAALHLVYNNGNNSGTIDEFRFAPVLSDGKGQRVFGLQFPAASPAGRYDRVRLALEMLASHPRTAEHICRQLAEHYVGDPAPDPLVRQMSVVYSESGGDMSAVLRTMVANQAFWSATPKMATPFDYGLRFARLCRASLVEAGTDPELAPKPDQLESFLKKSGMGMFDRVTPDGYPQGDDSYADSNALLQRWHFMEELPDALGRLVPKIWRTPPDAAAAPAGNDANPPPALGVDAGQRFIDLAAVRLTGRLLTPASNLAALDILGSGNTPAQFSQAMLFVSLLPETSLR